MTSTLQALSLVEKPEQVKFTSDYRTSYGRLRRKIIIKRKADFFWNFMVKPVEKK